MLVTKTDLRKATNASLFRRGEQLFKQSAVTILDLKEASVQGHVQDTAYRHRQVSIRQLPTGQLSAQCSCFVQSYPCVHTVAVLLAYLDEMERAGRIESAAPSWEDYLKHLPQLRQRSAIETEAQITKLLFFIQLNPKKWRLQPMPTYIKKNGELGRRSRLQFGYDGALYGDIEATSAELKAINAMKHRLRASGNSYGYSSDYFEFEYGEEAGFILDMLAESRLYLEESEKPLHAINSASQLFFELSNGVTGSDSQPAYQFFPQLQLNGHPEKLDDNYRILTSRPFWIIRGEKIFRVENSFPAPYLLPFTRKGYQLQIPSEKVEAFLQGFVPHLKHDIKLVLPENLSLQTAREVTGRRLYLREQNETLCVEPRFVYGEIEVGNLHEHQVNIPALSNGANGHAQTLWRVERDHAAEAAIHEALVAAGLKLDESREFYAPNQEPLVWLFDELPKLAQAGFEIFGEENLKRHRLNRATPNVRVAVSSDIDWFDLNVEIDFGGVMLSLANLKQAMRQQNQFVKLADGSLARLPEEWQKRFQHFFNFAKIDGKDGDAQIASSHAMLIDALFDEAEEKRYDENFRARLTKLKNFKGIAEVPAPKNFQGALRPYQQFGLNWLGFLKEYGFNGCLADDMGLGKTVQALAFLLREKSLNGQAARKKKRPEGDSEEKVKHKTSLIVAPLSVLFNWEKECARFAPDLKLHIHHGLDRAESAEHFAEHDIVLTTYATMRLDVEFLKDFPFHYVILDESQNIKNPISQTAKAASILQSNHRLVLTGTPVENNTVELWSQFSFLNPGMLGNLSYFQNSFSAPIERYGDEGAAKLLKKMISPFLLRRTKEEVVKELPPKSEQVYYCAMSDSQKRLYQQVRDQYRAEIMNMIDTTGLQDARFKVLQGLTKLRQLACHPHLIFENGNYDSGKFDSFLELLREIVAEGHKVLVFSQFVRMLKIVADEMKKEKIAFEVLTGATRDRQACVTRFQEDPKTKVFLISLKAGGLGLNLTAADYVMIYDPWWNPAAERQAIDRAHRIGQSKNVFVYKMITRDTVEEKILELQKRKANLVSQLITTDAGLFKHLTAEDIRGLFS
ncbi:DEAD/DEAH box helicase [candidate division KSB1 bacterium]|nr:DEAD/DEAH box helicase [candidate division KSB1 bacterium]